MKKNKFLTLTVIGLFAIPGSVAAAARPDKDHGDHHDNGHWRNKHKDHDDDDDQRGYGFAPHDRDEMRGWYAQNSRRLPPGLAKKDRLPPGLDKQLVRRGTLPPGLQKRIQPCPEELERRLPPPPPDCAHVLIGGHIVLLNRRTNIVVDIFHFER